MARVILSGAPGVGKTTLLATLAVMGFRTVSESARAIIAERLAAGLSPRPESLEFAKETLRRDTKKYEAVGSAPDLVFFDRGAIEAIAMVNEAQSMSAGELAAQLANFHFHPQVFILPPWREIYTTDSEREHTFEHAERVHGALTAWYAALGYAVHTVPCASLAVRALHVLHVIHHSAA